MHALIALNVERLSNLHTIHRLIKIDDVVLLIAYHAPQLCPALCWVQAAPPTRNANVYTVTYSSEGKTLGQGAYAAYTGWVCGTRSPQTIRKDIHKCLENDICRDPQAYTSVSEEEAKPHEAMSLVLQGAGGLFEHIA